MRVYSEQLYYMTHHNVLPHKTVVQCVNKALAIALCSRFLRCKSCPSNTATQCCVASNSALKIAVSSQFDELALSALLVAQICHHDTLIECVL